MTHASPRAPTARAAGPLKAHFASRAINPFLTEPCCRRAGYGAHPDHGAARGGGRDQYGQVGDGPRGAATKTGAVWELLGRGTGGLQQPAGPLDFGNSGTGTRLMMGVIAPHDIRVDMVGECVAVAAADGRVLKPLKRWALGSRSRATRTSCRSPSRGRPQLVPHRL